MKKENSTNVTVNDKKVSLNKEDGMIVLSALNKAGYKRESVLATKGTGVDIFYNDEYQTVYSRAPRVAEITINGHKASMLSKVKTDDVIVVKAPIAATQNVVTLTDIPGFNKNIEFNIDGRDIEVLRMVDLNGSVTFGDAEIKDGDKVFTRNYYSVGQLREMLDLDRDVVIVKNEEELDDNDKIYECEEIDTYVKAIYERFTDGTDSHAAELLTGDDLMEDIDNVSTDVSLGKEIQSEIDEAEEIKVMLNGEEVSLANKKDYAVIDALDAVLFDTSVLVGKSFTLKVNSERANFATQIYDNDIVEITY